MVFLLYCRPDRVKSPSFCKQITCTEETDTKPSRAWVIDTHCGGFQRLMSDSYTCPFLLGPTLLSCDKEKNTINCPQCLGVSGIQSLLPPPWKRILDISVLQEPLTLSPLSFLPGKLGCWALHAIVHMSRSAVVHPRYNPDSLSCSPLASMGLADMMSPGESKLSVPLKADGKEESVPQPESKSKVLPPPCMPWPLPAGLPGCPVPGAETLTCLLFMASCGTCLRSCLSHHPSWCGSESY